ncbi:MAG TPA: hypothetical protein VKB79_10675 [Bryobacteraceae bacterium]|nr:hypothetical protein [Bryobacteraceae bacterium]
MLAAAIALAMYPDWVPVRWPSGDPKSLDLLNGSAINCLWLERPQWSPEFAAAAAAKGIATLGVIHRDGDPIEAARALAKDKFTGGIIEGEFDDYSLSIVTGTLARAGMTYIESGPRSRLRFDTGAPILSTSQGMWPGIHIAAGGSASAGPTANPWIDTNTGFVRFVRASTDSTAWIAVTPPSGTAFPVQRYVQAIGDAAINGGRWVVALDDDLWKRILAREQNALKDWARIGAALRFFEDHKEWRAAAPAGAIAIVEDYDQARFSGGLFDMLAAKHMPVFPAPYAKVNAGALRDARLTVNPEPESTPAALAETIQSATQSGKTLISGPPPTKKAAPAEDEFVFDPTDTRVDTTWQRVSAAVGRQNLGARLFNVSSMLSNLVSLRGQRQRVLHLVNYSDYPATGITARVLGTWRRARLYRPGEDPVDLEIQKSDDGTEFSIDQRIVTIGSVVLE